MVVEVAQFEFTASGSTGNQEIASGLGFTPTGYIIFTTESTADATFSAEHKFFIGFSDGTTTFSQAIRNVDNSSSSSNAKAFGADFKNTTLVSGDSFAATHSSFGSGTITINWSDVPISSCKFYGIAFGGDISCEVKEFTVGTTGTGNQSYTTTMSNPECAIFLCPDESGGDSTNTSSGSMGIGIAISTTKRMLIALTGEFGRTNMDTWGLFDDTVCFGSLVDSSGAIDFKADFVSWDANGFTLNYTDAPPASTHRFFGFFMKGAVFDCGTVAKRTSTGDTVITATSSIGTTKGIMILSDNLSKSTTVQSHLRLSFGVASGTTTEGGVWTGDQDAAANAVTASRSEDSNILVMATENATHGSSTVEAIANISSISNNEFTLTYTTCTSLTADLGWLVIGQAPSGAEELYLLSAYYASDK